MVEGRLPGVEAVEGVGGVEGVEKTVGRPEASSVGEME